MNIGDMVKIKFTGETAMIVGTVTNSEVVYIVRLTNYSEHTFRLFEIEKV